MKNIGATTGQSLSEYGVILALAGLASIAGLTVLGGTLGVTGPALMNALYGVDRQNQGPIVANPTPATPAPENPAPPSGDPVVPAENNLPPNTVLLTLTTASGNEIQIPYPEDLALSVETAGANGTTDNLSSALAALAQELFNNGEITEAELRSLQNLSTMGHNLADVQSQLETLAETSDGISLRTYRDFILTNPMDPERPQTVSFSSLLSKLEPVSGFDPATSNILSLPHARYSFDPVSNFAKAYSDAQNNGALTNPKVAGVVEALSRDILKVNKSFTAASRDLQMQIVSDPTMSTAVLKDLTTSQIVHSNSRGICATGGGQDNGYSCNG